MKAGTKLVATLTLCAAWSVTTFAQQSSDKPVPWKATASWKVSHPETPSRGPRLAILVSADKAHQSEAVALQGLLEVEAFSGWHGELLERAQLSLVFDEQKLAALSDANAIKLGQLAQADFLMLVEIRDDRIACRINQFPATTVVAEFDLTKTAEDRLARQLALRAFRGMAERVRDQNRIAVAIGSLLVNDPFGKYTDLDRTLHVLLRDRLTKTVRIDLAERFHPTQLLREFELARGGLVPSAVAQLTAPASDLLVTGEIRPITQQNLERQDIELEFRIRVVSPTGLFEATELTFLLPKADWNRAADQIEKSIQQIVAAIPATPVRRADSESVNAEFKTLKQRVFRLLPSPPKEDGNFFSKGSYRGSWQSGKPSEIERAMRAVENALLLKGDDTQLLVCAVPLLFELAQSEAPGRRIERPTVRQKALLELSCDYIETALALDFNENTRGITYDTLRREDYWLALPDRTRPLVERMAREGVKGGWYPHEAEYSRHMLVLYAPTLDAKIGQFRLAHQEKDLKPAERLRLLQTLTNHYLKQINAKSDAMELRQSADQLHQVAKELLQEKSSLFQGMGQYVNLFVAYYAEPKSPAWADELRASIDLIPSISKELGADFINCEYSLLIYHFVRWAGEPMPNETSRGLLRQYISRQVEIQNYQHGNLADALLKLLPTLQEKDYQAEALPWLTRILERYNYGGSADFDRMRLARLRNHLQQSLSGTQTQARDVLVDIALDSVDARADQTRIKKIVFAFDRIWALRCDSWLQDRLGEIYSAEPTETHARRIPELSSRLTDMVPGREQLAVASIDKGLALIDSTGKTVKAFTPENSPLPTAMVRTVASDGARFLLGLPGRVEQTGYSSYFVYELDPQQGTLKQTETKLDYHSYYQTRYELDTKRVVSQTWDHRDYETANGRRRFRRTLVRDAVHKVTVTDESQKLLFAYTGFDLNYVYDFVEWRGRLLFATGNGLYSAQAGSDELDCLLSEVDLEFFSLCPVGDKLFVGTNRGLHRLDAAMFDRMTVDRH